MFVRARVAVLALMSLGALACGDVPTAQRTELSACDDDSCVASAAVNDMDADVWPDSIYLTWRAHAYESYALDRAMQVGGQWTSWTRVAVLPRPVTWYTDHGVSRWGVYRYRAVRQQCYSFCYGVVV